MVNLKSFIGLLVILSLFIFGSVLAADYGEGRYSLGIYGQGEDSEGGGGAAGGGGGGGSGSSTSTSTQNADNTIMTLSTPDDLPGDVAESIFELTCTSGACTVTANEVSDLPGEIAIVYETMGGSFVAAVRLVCNGNVGQGTAQFTLEPVAGTTCDNIRVSHVQDDGTVNPTDITECTIESDGSMSLSVSFEGCSYLVVWQAQEEGVQPTVAPPELTEEEVITTETAQTAAGTGAGVWILILVLVVVILVVYFVYKKKRTKF